MHLTARFRLVGRLLASCSLGFALASPAAEPAANDPLAILEVHCVKCHGGEKTKGGLDLVTREALLRGGDSGAAIVTGKPESSLLFQMVRHEKEPAMPHKERKLPDDAIARLGDWIKAGVPYSRTLSKTAGGAAAEGFAITEADRQHWSFQPVRRIDPPKVQNEQTVANPIDRFIIAKLEANGLTPAPRASRETLIRRVTFDLIGLPPTPKEIDAFVKDTSPDAYARLIDRLLASPHYGERWGRHWLDLARYAETDGFEHDAVRPHSWRYRDYVIRAFNEDKPYDRFIREQLAGDELWPDQPDALTATGFNLLGPDMVDSADQVQRRLNTLNDMTDTAALTFLGLTMGCARCHDHKFEPLSQHDYYSLQAFFTPAIFRREQPIPTPEARVAYDKGMKEFNAWPQVRELAEIETPVREKLRKQKLAKLSPEAQVAHTTPPEKRTTEQANLVLETEAMLDVPDKQLATVFTGPAAERRRVLLEEIKKLPKPPSLPMAMAMGNSNSVPARTFILVRGDYNSPGDAVAAAFPTVVAGKAAPAAANGSCRTALADWITSPDNPLTARVMVNRLWQHHFGRGIVATPSDFGTRGQPPTHPELLDWLAGEFVTHGWSLKHMHRLMLLSATYQQASSVPRPANADRDPDNKLLWHMNRLRLEGEVIRDSLLSIGGELNLEFGGPGVFPPIPKELFQGAKGWSQNDRVRDYSRRSVYIFARRNLRYPFLEVFDAPDSNLSCPVRERSTTAPQALTLLNADEVLAASKATTERLQREAATEAERIALLYRLTLGRAPSERERALAGEFLKQSPLNELCRALFNLNEFVYLN